MALSAASLALLRGSRAPGFDPALSSANLSPANLSPANLLPANLTAAEELHALLEVQHAERVLPLGADALDAVLPHGGLVQGSVIELQVQGAGAAATSFALCACRAAQRTAAQRHASSSTAVHSRAVHSMGGRHPAPAHDARPWCAFIDPSASLFAPGVARLGVDLERLLVVRPDVEAIERVAVRIAEAKAVSLLVIDLQGTLGSLPVSSQRWPRTVRRLALAVKHLATCVLLITPAEPRSALPLPVAMRLEFTRARADSFEIRVGKERSGRVSSPRRLPWSAFDEVAASTPALDDRAAFDAAAFDRAAFDRAAFDAARLAVPATAASTSWREARVS